MVISRFSGSKPSLLHPNDSRIWGVIFIPPLVNPLWVIYTWELSSYVGTCQRDPFQRLEMWPLTIGDQVGSRFESFGGCTISLFLAYLKIPAVAMFISPSTWIPLKPTRIVAQENGTFPMLFGRSSRQFFTTVGSNRRTRKINTRREPKKWGLIIKRVPKKPINPFILELMHSEHFE